MYGLHCLFEDQCKNYGKSADDTTCCHALPEVPCGAKNGFIKKQEGKEDKDAESKDR